MNARTYKNATLLFNLARPFVLANPHITALLDPPWQGLAQPMWDPIQIRHRSAYYDAFFSEALMDFVHSGLATPGETASAQKAVADMIRFCIETSREEVRLGLRAFGAGTCPCRCSRANLGSDLVC